MSEEQYLTCDLVLLYFVVYLPLIKLHMYDIRGAKSTSIGPQEHVFDFFNITQTQHTM